MNTNPTIIVVTPVRNEALVRHTHFGTETIIGL